MSLYSTVLGPRVGLDPQRHNFVLPITTCWYLKSPKFALPPTPTHNATRWNVGGVGAPTQNSHIGHVDFMLFVSLSRSQREHNFQCSFTSLHWGCVGVN